MSWASDCQGMVVSYDMSIEDMYIAERATCNVPRSATATVLKQVLIVPDASVQTMKHHGMRSG